MDHSFITFYLFCSFFFGVLYWRNQDNVKILILNFLETKEKEFDLLQEKKEEPTKETKYEDKYLEELHEMNVEYEFFEQEEEKTGLENLKHCYIIEKTPLGNVAMYYNNVRETFEYYSDSTIPYRFLEVVARKYVITYKCRPLYIVMEEELKKYEKQMEDKIKRMEEVNANINATASTIQQRKNVFAKFKSYNKEAGSGRVNKAPPPKNSIPNSKNISSNNDEKVLLKENANRYTYEGRFSNFNPLQKIQRKQVDQKYALTFADFKKMQNK